ncbi:MAG: hypothetical protein HOE90_14785 [Bacteriovoracaceae bacterium]|nr:hypothetical protein [Bacteriovoracaceae bacterium]
MKRRIDIWVLDDCQNSIQVYRQALGVRYNIRFFSDFENFFGALQSDVSRPELSIIEPLLGDEQIFDYTLNELNKDALAKMNHIVVTSIDDIDVMRHCYFAGARDYVVKPFSKNELVIRVERIVDPNAIGHLEVKQFNLASLTHRERQILECFLNSPSRGPVTREEIQQKVWKGIAVTPKTLDVHIHNLRKKLVDANFQILSRGQGEWQLEQIS